MLLAQIRAARTAVAGRIIGVVSGILRLLHIVRLLAFIGFTDATTRGLIDASVLLQMLPSTVIFDCHTYAAN